MDRKVYLIGLVVLLVGFVTPTNSFANYIGENSIGKREECLGINSEYLVEWEAFLDTKSVIFELTVATTGFVEFGISPAGGMTGADIIVGGVFPNGTAYFGNYHGVENGAPVVDENETWELLHAWENTTHTYLRVGRSWNTCDSNDVAIENSTNNFIWSLGQSDNIGYHGTNRGTTASIILDPPMPSVDTDEFKSWRMTNTMEMPEQSTTYWCTVQKSPSLDTKHHIIGFRPILDTPEALRHTHHFVLHTCSAPEGSTDEEFFERFIGQAGGECYNGSPDVPIQHCQNFMFIWAVGGKTVVYPDHLGYPLAVDGKTTYHLLEVHYDNPNNLQGVVFEMGMEILYTPQVRQYDFGLMAVGHHTSHAITIPPRSEAHVIVGHCSPSCSSRIPEPGVKIFQVLLHSHLAGRKLKLRHYRDGIELPWITSDDHYDFNFQQFRTLFDEVKVLPGDQLTLECTYTSMDANGTVLGGLSTREEMCNSNLAYYPAMELDMCRSNLLMTDLLKEFGIEGVDDSINSHNPLITSPERMAGKTYKEVLDTLVPWTSEFKSHIQNLTRYGDHGVACGRSSPDFTNLIHYYDTSIEYVPPLDECQNRENTEPPETSGSDNKHSVVQCSLYLIVCMFTLVILKLWV